MEFCVRYNLLAQTAVIICMVSLAWYHSRMLVLYTLYILSIILLLDEFRVEVLQTSHSNKLGLHGYYVMRVSDTAIVLYSASGILPTQFHCSLNGIIQAHYSKVIESGRKQTILVIKTNKWVYARKYYNVYNYTYIRMTVIS